MGSNGPECWRNGELESGKEGHLPETEVTLELGVGGAVVGIW